MTNATTTKTPANTNGNRTYSDWWTTRVCADRPQYRIRCAVVQHACTTVKP